MKTGFAKTGFARPGETGFPQVETGFGELAKPVSDRVQVGGGLEETAGGLKED